jgi:hypothetical protein
VTVNAACLILRVQDGQGSRRTGLDARLVICRLGLDVAGCAEGIIGFEFSAEHVEAPSQDQAAETENPGPSEECIAAESSGATCRAQTEVAAGMETDVRTWR